MVTALSSRAQPGQQQTLPRADSFPGLSLPIGSAPLKREASLPLKLSPFPKPLGIFHRNRVQYRGYQCSGLAPRKLKAGRYGVAVALLIGGI